MADMQTTNVQGNGNGVRWDAAPDDSRAVYSGFLGFTKLAIVLVSLVLIGMAIFLV